MAQSGSFIPQQPSARPAQVRRRRVYILSYVAYTIFLGVIITVIGLLVWQTQLESALASQQSLLEEQRSSFSQSDIIRVEEMETQLQLVDFLLDSQPAFTTVLTALEETSVTPVYITDFEVISEESLPGQVFITYNGLANSFETVIALRSVMSTHPLLSEATIVDVTYGQIEDSENEIVELSAQTPVGYEVELMIPIEAIMFAGLAAVQNDETTDALSTEEPVTADDDTAAAEDEDSEPVDAVDSEL